MKYLNKYYIKCLNLILKKELNFIKFNNKHIILNQKNKLIKNLIFNKVNYQEKDHLEKL